MYFLKRLKQLISLNNACKAVIPYGIQQFHIIKQIFFTFYLAVTMTMRITMIKKLPAGGKLMQAAEHGGDTRRSSGEKILILKLVTSLVGL